MLEISLHILDIVNNSVKAGATLVEITVEEALAKNSLRIQIDDDGCGMDQAFLEKVLDPFQTTRSTRKVGMGLSLFRAAAQAAGGDLTIRSEKGIGTSVCAEFVYDHIDRQPLGSMADTMVALISGNMQVDFVYRHRINECEFVLDTREMKRILGQDVDFSCPEIILWVKEFVSEGIGALKVNEKRF